MTDTGNVAQAIYGSLMRIQRRWSYRYQYRVIAGGFWVYSSMVLINEISNFIVSEISATEHRDRKRSTDAQHHFEYAIEAILKDVWKGTAISPNYGPAFNEEQIGSHQIPDIVTLI